ncbi:hypothetical protein DPMN_002878 [Dreissena polymorpha]|uniref:Uncharacterized protein n=1 Tax=Dreissena polymorpha TaxID=45954 RepID=A0A9D4MJX7_DREPO|nr:hypothetical protein DPMN_002878 [Dreissena polymorpha]
MINKASFPNIIRIGAVTASKSSSASFCTNIPITIRVLTWKTAAPTEAMFLNKQEPFSKISRAIIRANLQTRLNWDWFHYRHIRKTATPPGGYVFQRTVTIFKLSRDVNSTNVLTKLHEYWTINVHSRVLKITNVLTTFNEDWNINVNPRVLTRSYYSYSWKTAPIIAMIESNVMTKLHKDWTISVTSRVLTSKLPHPYIVGTLVLAKFHENWTIHVTSRVIELDQNIIGTNHLTRFYECYQGKILTTHDGQKVIPKAHHKHVVLR